MAGGPGHVVVAVLLENDGLVGRERVSVFGYNRLLHDILGRVVHGQRGPSRVGGAGGRGRTDGHRGDGWRVRQHPAVHRMRSGHVGRQVGRSCVRGRLLRDGRDYTAADNAGGGDGAARMALARRARSRG